MPVVPYLAIQISAAICLLFALFGCDAKLCVLVSELDLRETQTLAESSLIKLAASCSKLIPVVSDCVAFFLALLLASYALGPNIFRSVDSFEP